MDKVICLATKKKEREETKKQKARQLALKRILAEADKLKW